MFDFIANILGAKNKPTSQVREVRKTRQLRLESLEDRSMPSGAPAAPVFTATAVSGSQIDLSWKVVAGATNYFVDELVNNAWVQIANPSSKTTSYDATGMTSGTTYVFAVAADNASGWTFATPESIATMSAPAAPTFAVATDSASQLELSWGPVTGATSYLIEEWENNAWKEINNVSGRGTSIDVTGLSGGSSNWFDVVAANSVGSTWGSPQLGTTWPEAPTLTASAASTSEIDLSWNNVSGATNYMVEEVINNAWVEIGDPASGVTSYSVTGLSASNSYTFAVAADNSAGWTFSKPVSVDALSVPAAPALTATAVSTSQVNVSWNSISGATSYQVQEVVNGSWKQIASLNGGSTSYLVTGLTAGITYDFDVVAVNAGGATWGDQQFATTLVGSTSTLTDPGWSGYAINPGSQVTAVGGTWVVPVMTSTGSNSVASEWVGIDGFKDSTVEQLGTSWNAQTGTYQAWIEFYGDGVENAAGEWIYKGEFFSQTNLGLVVQPGDTVSAEIAFVANTRNTFEFKFNIVTPEGIATNWSDVLSMSYQVPKRASAEWIVESPSGAAAPLANFGSIEFTGAWATVGTTTGSIDSFPNYALNMVPENTSGGGTDYTYGITNSTSPGYGEPSGGSSSFMIYFGSANSSVANSAEKQSTEGVSQIPVNGKASTAMNAANIPDQVLQDVSSRLARSHHGGEDLFSEWSNGVFVG